MPAGDLPQRIVQFGVWRPSALRRRLPPGGLPPPGWRRRVLRLLRALPLRERLLAVPRGLLPALLRRRVAPVRPSASTHRELPPRGAAQRPPPRPGRSGIAEGGVPPR